MSFPWKKYSWPYSSQHFIFFFLAVFWICVVWNQTELGRKYNYQTITSIIHLLLTFFNLLWEISYRRSKIRNFPVRLDYHKIICNCLCTVKSRFFLISNTRKPLKKHKFAKWTSEVLHNSKSIFYIQNFTKKNMKALKIESLKSFATKSNFDLLKIKIQAKSTITLAIMRWWGL